MALNFPAKVYQILENESIDIIRWHDNGMAFRILDHGRFEREIIPKYFRHNQLSSVQRQLNLYGFKCISRGEDKGAFFHANFKRGDWETVRKITRYIPVKKSFLEDGFSDRKPSGDENYVFQDGAYKNANAIYGGGGGRGDEDSFPSVQDSYYNESVSFALFQSKPGDDSHAECATSSKLEWSGYSQLSKKPEEEKVKFAPPPPPVFKPSMLTSRLGYKFPSVSQMTTSSAAGAQPRDFIIITNNIVRIDPDYDLADCLNYTYDFDVGRHSVNSDSVAQIHLPSIPAAPQQTSSVPESMYSHMSSLVKSSLSGNSLSIYPSASEEGHQVADMQMNCGGRLERANSMDDFVELCAGLDE